MQVHASAHGLRLITFDADGTLYADGAHMDQDNEMINHILTLLHQDEVRYTAAFRFHYSLEHSCDC